MAKEQDLFERFKQFVKEEYNDLTIKNIDE